MADTPLTQMDFAAATTEYDDDKWFRECISHEMDISKLIKSYVGTGAATVDKKEEKTKKTQTQPQPQPKPSVTMTAEKEKEKVADDADDDDAEWNRALISQEARVTATIEASRLANEDRVLEEQQAIWDEECVREEVRVSKLTSEERAMEKVSKLRIAV